MLGDALHDLKNCYKIKLRGAGYRLVYRVEDERIVILVLAIGNWQAGAKRGVSAGGEGSAVIRSPALGRAYFRFRISQLSLEFLP